MGGPPVGPPVILPIQDRNILRFQAYTVESLPVLTVWKIKKEKKKDSSRCCNSAAMKTMVNRQRRIRKIICFWLYFVRIECDINFCVICDLIKFHPSLLDDSPSYPIQPINILSFNPF